MAERTIVDLSNMGVDNVPETVLLDKGAEVELRIVGMTSGEDKNNQPYIMFFYDVPDQPEVDEISDFIGLPNANREERDNIKSKRKLKAIGQCFDIDWSQQVSADDVKGKRGFGIIGLNKDKTQNVVSEYIIR